MTGYQPNPGERYWCIRGIRPWVASHVWEGDRLDQLLRDTGRTFKTEEEAQAALRLAAPMNEIRAAAALTSKEPNR